MLKMNKKNYSWIIAIIFLVSMMSVSALTSGGNKTYIIGSDGLNYTLHTFNFTGTYVFNTTTSLYGFSYLIVAGGGAGGAQGGGGGAGGVIYNNSGVTFPQGVYTVIVGSGGQPQGVNAKGSNGTNSSFNGLIAIGGGGGGASIGSQWGVNGEDGGSGGGGGYYGAFASDGGNGVIGQGYHGGNMTGTLSGQGGGGGSNSSATNGLNAVGGNGGNGTNYNITGTLRCYAGGGGGGVAGAGTGGTAGCGGGNGAISTNNGFPAINGTGSGGGGGDPGNTNTGGQGGSGIIIIRFLTSTDASITFTGPSESGTTKYLPSNYLLVNVSILNYTNYTSANISVYNSVGLYSKYSTTNATQFVNFTLPMTNDTYYYNVSATNGTSTISSPTYTNYIQYATLNVTAFNSSTLISNFSINLTDTSTGLGTIFNTSTGSILGNVIIGHSYNVLLDATGFAYDYFNVTINSSSTSVARYLAIANSINITIRDETNNSIINSATIVTVTSLTNQYTYTINGNALLSNLIPDTYVLTFTNGNYSVKTYTVTVGYKSTQFLTAFLLSAYSSTVFTYLDSATGTPLSNVLAIMYGYVNGTLTPVASQISDPTGRIQWVFKVNTPYQFYSEKSGYVSKIFSLSPAILFTAYNVPMIKSSTVSTPDDINIYYTPQSLSTSAINSFKLYFQSPNGLLVRYNYILTSNCFNASSSGNNVNGQPFTIPISILSCTDTTMLLTTNYTTSSGLNSVDTYNIPIQSQIGNYTIMGNSQQTFGMGIFERTLIVVLITLVVVGVASILRGIIAGTIMLLLVLGYFSLITGFINTSATIIVLIVGAVILFSKGVNT